jgi:hypothetical protein
MPVYALPGKAQALFSLYPVQSGESPLLDALMDAYRSPFVFLLSYQSGDEAIQQGDAGHSAQARNKIRGIRADVLRQRANQRVSGARVAREEGFRRNKAPRAGRYL